MKILLVRLSSMGDLIHTLPALTDLARHLPQAELHWLCETSFADIARLHPFVRRIHTLRLRQWRKRWWDADVWRQIGSLKSSLRAEGYDCVLDAQSLLKSAWAARLSGVPVTGLDAASAREPLAARFYRRRYPVAKGRDAVWRNRTLFAQAFGYTFDGAADFGVEVPAAGSLNGLPPRYFAALHATSRDSKLWPQPNWAALLTELHRRYRLPVLLPWGSPAEKARAEAMAAELPFAVVCPPLNLLQAAFMLQGAQAVIGVDTGLLHLADALERPLVGIYTDSDPHKTGVQPSPRALSLGGIGQCPDADEALSAVEQVMQAA